MVTRELPLAIRNLAKSPAFTITAVLSLALGIGASTATSSVANGVLLRPLLYTQPDRLVFVISDLRVRGVDDFPLSSADFIDMRAGGGAAFQDVAAVLTGRGAVPRRDGSMEQIRWARVTPAFFRLMGARIALGRDFVDADGQPFPASAGTASEQPSRASPMAAIISHEYWQRRFGGDASVVGSDLPGTAPGAVQIVGVLAPGFELLFPPQANIERAPDHWLAIRPTYDAANRTAVSLRAIARLKDGVTLSDAQSVADRLASDLRSKSTTWQTAGYELRVERMQRHLVAQVRPALVVFTGAALLLLLIACANVANLLLVRTASRGEELAVRRALGGTFWQLVSPTVAEALILVVAGAAGGAGLAWLGTQRLRLIAPPNVPRLDAIAMDAQVAAFAIAVTAAAMAIVCLVPLSYVWRARPAGMLRTGGRTTGPGSARTLLNVVVIAAVAVSFVLLIGSGLMIRSFVALQRIDPQFDPQGVLTFQLLGSRGGARPEQRAAFMREIRERLLSIPGVQDVTASTPFPLTSGFNATRWGTEDAIADPRRLQSADFQTVLPGYFETLRTPLLEGRTFTEADNAPGRNVVVIDRLLASKAFPNQSAVGKRLVVRPNMLAEVIGVVAHQRASSLAELGREQIYFTDGFMGHGLVSRWAVRTAANPERYADAVRAAITEVGSRVVLTEMQPMTALVDAAQATTRFALLLIGTFAVCAGLLAAIGLYGVLSTAVRQRKGEIGVRMALGAAPFRIYSLVVRHAFSLSAVGVAAGLASALMLTRGMTGMLVDVEPADPGTFAAVVLLFFSIVAIASWLPARRAARLDPVDVLRGE